jgi:serine phosphatase RsbU (regulator of sigma subunit)
MNLVCLPIARGRSSLIVAAVPVERIESEFLAGLKGDYSTGVYLFDDSLHAMASSRPQLVGADVRKEDDQAVRRMLGEFEAIHFDGSLVVNEPARLAGEHFEPGILTASPVEVLPGKEWKLVIGTSLKEVDRVVSAFYRKTVVWALVLAGAVTGILASTAFQMIRSRARFERERHGMLTRELDQARQIQLAWLPQKPLTRWEIDVAAVNRPANHISGDFYNWFDLPDGRTAVVIGDVTGHGMSAAFLMATAQLLVRNTLPVVRDPGRCLEEVNRQLCVQVFNGQFVTMQILVFDPEQRTVEIATAGHPAPLLCGPDRCFTPVPVEPQLVLGVEADTAIPTESFEVPPDATLILYTDGVTDLESDDGRRLYVNGLKEHLADGAGSASEMLDALMMTLDRYRGTRDIGDDLTVVVVRFQPQASEGIAEESKRERAYSNARPAAAVATGGSASRRHPEGA